VLGGGGSTGNAWLIGVVAGLHAAGVDATAAELLVGTSAGATAAVQVATGDPSALLDAVLASSAAAEAHPHRRTAVRSAAQSMSATGDLIASSAGLHDMRRRLGASAIARDHDGTFSATWHRTVAGRLLVDEWPSRRLLIPAVDADTGTPVIFERDSGVSIVDAVAASCASGIAYRIGHRRFIDGGYRRNENADLASGSRVVLVLSPFGGRSRHPREWGTWLSAQVAELRAQGAGVHVVAPGAEFERMGGARAMDPGLRADAARLGRAQGEALAPQLAALGW
jgi:NTE family protein